MDNYNPDWVWFASGFIAMMAVAGYLLLHLRAHKRIYNMNNSVKTEMKQISTIKVENAPDSKTRNGHS